MLKEINPYTKAQLKRHRQWIATLPCARCEVELRSQCAHIKDKTGTAGAEDWHTLPLCCQRPGIEGCHAEQHRVSEPVFYKPYGGIEVAKRLAENLFKATGDDAEGTYLLEQFRSYQ